MKKIVYVIECEDFNVESMVEEIEDVAGITPVIICDKDDDVEIKSSIHKS